MLISRWRYGGTAILSLMAMSCASREQDAAQLINGLAHAYLFTIGQPTNGALPDAITCSNKTVYKFQGGTSNIQGNVTSPTVAQVTITFTLDIQPGTGGGAMTANSGSANSLSCTLAVSYGFKQPTPQTVQLQGPGTITDCSKYDCREDGHRLDCDALKSAMLDNPCN